MTGEPAGDALSREEFQEQAVLYELGRLPPERRDGFERELAAKFAGRAVRTP